jgi:hypothetical protein
MNRFLACTLTMWLVCIVSLNAQDAAFDSFVARIAKQYRVDIALSPELIPTVDSILDSGTRITSIDELLKLLVHDKHLTYQIVDGNKVMLRKDETISSTQGVAMIEGTIIDQQEKGPLAYALIHIVNTTKGCQTDENGHFTLWVPDSISRIQIDYLGYASVQKPVSDFLKGPVTIPLKLHEIPLEEVTIIIPYKEVYQDPQTQSLNLTQFTLISESQILQWNGERLISTLTSYTQYSADEGIRIRGVEPQNSLFLMDQLPVYNPYHYYNIFTPFNPNYFSSIKLYKNNLPVNYGGRIDGMIQLSSEQAKQHNHLILESDLLLSSAETRVGIGKDFSFAAGARVSHTGILNQDLRDSTVSNFRSPGKFKSQHEWTSVQQPTFNFYDVNAGVEGKISPGSSVYLNGFSSEDHLNTTTYSSLSTSFQNQEVVNVDQSYENKDQWDNMGVSTGITSRISSQVSLSMDAFYSHYEKKESYTSDYEEEHFGMVKSMQNFGSLESRLNNSGLKGTFKKTLTDQSSYQAGLDLNQYKVNLLADENGSHYFTQSQQEFETTVFGDYQFWPSHRLMMVLGSRITHLNQPSKSYFLPNLQASYFPGHHFNVRGAFSQSVQAVHEITIVNRFGNEMESMVLNDADAHYPVLRSDKYMIGGGYTATHFSFDAEFYYKKLDGLMRVATLRPDPAFDDHSPPDRYYNLFTGNGWTAGMDITTYYKQGKTDLILSYTLSKIAEQYAGLFNGNEFSPEEDRRHQLKFSGKHRFGHFEPTVQLTYKSKAPYLSFVQVENHDNNHEHGDIGIADQSRVFEYLPAFFSLDLGMDYSFNFFKQKAQVGISVINATDHANIEAIQHIGRVSGENMQALYLTQQTELLGRTWNARFRIMF